MRAFLDYPAPLFLAVLVCSWLGLRALKPANRLLKLIGNICGCVSLATLAGLLILNLFRAGIIWHDEANVLSVSASLLRGQDIYTSPSAPYFYSLLYGPATFLAYAPLIWWPEHPLQVTRYAISIVQCFNVFLLWRIVRLWLPPALAATVIPLATAALCLMPSITLGARGDPWLLCCISIALLAALNTDWRYASIVCGLACGAAINFKISLIPVVWLVFLLLCKHHRLRQTSVISVFVSMFTLTALGVFLLPHISLANYLAWLEQGSHQHLLINQLFENLGFCIVLTTGAIVIHVLGRIEGGTRYASVLLPVSALAALLSCAVSGAKDGAGIWHLLPMLPFALAWTSYETARTGAAQGMLTPSSEPAMPVRGILLAMTALAIATTVATVRYGERSAGALITHAEASQRRFEATAEMELKALPQRFPGRNFSMGYGALIGDGGSYLRFELPLERQNFFFDENSVVEATKAAIPIPQNVVNRVNSCSDIWLIPHGEKPFATSRAGVLPASSEHYLFPDSIRSGFLINHSRISSGAAYDLWACA